MTTDLVLAESVALLNAHLGRPAGLTFWGTLRETRIPVLTPEPADLEAAWHIAQAYADQAFSFVDCTTFAIMERLGIDDAFAFDAHFLVYRFGPGRPQEVPPPAPLTAQERPTATSLGELGGRSGPQRCPRW